MVVLSCLLGSKHEPLHNDLKPYKIQSCNKYLHNTCYNTFNTCLIYVKNCYLIKLNLNYVDLLWKNATLKGAFTTSNKIYSIYILSTKHE